MTIVRHMAFTPFRPDQLYDLANNVEAYPSFLPWCVGAVVLAKTEQMMRARLELKKGPLHYSFTTDNKLDPGRSIEMSLVDGPFKRLHGRWRFTPVDGGSTIHLELEFEFANRIAGAALAAAFRPIADSLVDAFKSRAQALYGS
jgi:ribosome-associated toxin RatA of RatAB toxin-antitoxin module